VWPKLIYFPQDRSKWPEHHYQFHISVQSNQSDPSCHYSSSQTSSLLHERRAIGTSTFWFNHKETCLRLRIKKKHPLRVSNHQRFKSHCWLPVDQQANLSATAPQGTNPSVPNSNFQSSNAGWNLTFIIFIIFISKQSQEAVTAFQSSLAGSSWLLRALFRIMGEAIMSNEFLFQCVCFVLYGLFWPIILSLSPLL
jgi:hypothetical protein